MCILSLMENTKHSSSSELIGWGYNWGADSEFFTTQLKCWNICYKIHFLEISCKIQAAVAPTHTASQPEYCFMPIADICQSLSMFHQLRDFSICRWKDYTIEIRQLTQKLLLRRRASKIILKDQPSPSQIDINYDCKDHNPTRILKHTFPVHGTVVQRGDLSTRNWHTISLNPIYTPQFYRK